MSDDPSPLDKFGRFVMEHLRDPGLEDIEFLAAGKWRAPGLQALQADLAGLDERQRDIVRRCVRSAVDRAIHDFLFKLQERADFENDIQVMVDGQNVVPLSDGIHGEAYGEDGWEARFSKYGRSPEEA